MERRGIGHHVPILGGRRLAEVVPLVGGACPSVYCQVDVAVHLVGPVPTPHGALGGRQASERWGPASGASASAQPTAGEYMANGLTNAVRHEFVIIANYRQTFVAVRKHSRSFMWCCEY